MVSFAPQIAQQIPRLKEADVHVWKLSLLAEAASNKYSSLSDDEVRKIARLKNQRHRVYAVSMRGQLRELLSCYLDLPAGDIRFQQAAYGKPYIVDSALSFNISHSGSRALVAVALKKELGVDIEKWRHLDNLEGMVNRNFSIAEQAEWLDVADDERMSTFFNIWTCKEAFIKATGRGLGLGVSRCGFSLSQPNKLLECPSEYGEASHWSCVSLEVGQQVSASLMMKSSRCEPVIYTFDSENLPQII